MRLDPFFDKETRWPEELRRLRAILLDFPLSEELKWRQPCYTFQGSNVAILYSMKDCCGVGFFKGALIDDPDGVLVAPGRNSQAARQMRFTSVAEIDAQEATLRSVIASAIGVEEAGLKVDFKAKRDLVYPQELLDRMERDAAFRAAFEALTPGRRRGYTLHFEAASQSKTRAARIDKHAARILEGKGLHDR